MAETPEMRLDQTRIADGIWEGILSGAMAGPPQIEALHLGRKVEGVEVQALPGVSGRFAVRVPIPAWALNEGVQSLLVQSGEVVLARFTLVAGQPLDEDIRAELSLLRAELDLLKRAFQRHCQES